MTEWQYAQLSLDQNLRKWVVQGDDIEPGPLLDVLNALGARGWELMPFKIGFFQIFKRETPAST
jgi:hypothetical protein